MLTWIRSLTEYGGKKPRYLCGSRLFIRLLFCFWGSDWGSFQNFWTTRQVMLCQPYWNIWTLEIYWAALTYGCSSQGIFCTFVNYNRCFIQRFIYLLVALFRCVFNLGRDRLCMRIGSFETQHHQGVNIHDSMWCGDCLCS